MADTLPDRISGYADEFDPEQLPPATRRRGWLTVRVGLADDLRLPVHVIRGARPGATALLAAGVHGDEFEGIAALPRVLDRLDPATVAGTVLALPICNPFAYHAQLRTSPPHIDSGNLAREFPGDRNGTPTQRLAAALFDLTTRLLGQDDLVVDLHSAGTRYRYLNLVGFRDFDVPARAASEQAARHFGSAPTSRLWSIWADRGMFNSETTLAGIPTVAAEAPGQGRCRLRDVEHYVDGVTNLLRYQGITPGGPPQAHPDPAICPTEVRAEVDGMFITDRDIGDHVHAGERLGTITSPHGRVRREVHAPQDGEIWAIRTFATVYTGEYLLWVAPC